ncbi:MAG: hypothetical protein Q4C73_10265 [Eubacteriales bacterium]|nr:hypothetical protein [Eubacteriales bacterium]
MMIKAWILLPLAALAACCSACAARGGSEPLPQMIYIENTCLSSAGRPAVGQDQHPLAPDTETDGAISGQVSENERPKENGQANFPCTGSPYVLLADGAAALKQGDAYTLFLSDDTVEYEGIYKKKSEVSEKTLEWLEFYYSLSEDERLAISMVPSEFIPDVRSASVASASETSSSPVSYTDALTEDELAQTEALAMYYFTEEVPSFEGVDQIYPVSSDDILYQNAGLEGEYDPGNIIIYRVLTVRDRRDGSPFRFISIARNTKSGDWKVINSGY